MVWKEIFVACWRIIGGKTVDRASGLRGVMCRRLHPGMKIMYFLEEHVQAMLANILFPSTSAPPVFAEGLKFSRMLRATFRRFFGGTASAREPNLGGLEGLLTSDKLPTDIGVYPQCGCQKASILSADRYKL